MTNTLIITMTSCPTDGACNKRLAKLCDMTLSDYLWSFDHAAIMDQPVGVLSWNEAAYRRGANLLSSWAGAHQRIVLFGLRTYYAFFERTPNWEPPWYDWQPWPGAQSPSKFCVAPTRNEERYSIYNSAFWRELARAER